MKKALQFFCIFCLTSLACMICVSCEENVDDAEKAEYANWPSRNAEFFANTLATARAEVAKAQAEYGDDWQKHCPWRLMLSYAKEPGGLATDTICAKVIETGTGTVSPLFTDSVRVCYIGHLIPTENYPEGQVFDFSGPYNDADYIFNPDFPQTATFAVSRVVEGFSTALMNMHVGDRWMVYMSNQMAYGNISSGKVRPYSTLCFDLQLKAFFRKGTSTTGN